MTLAVAMHEWRRLRVGALFWVLLACTQLLIAWLAFAQLEAFAKIAPQLKAAGSRLGALDLVIVPSLNSLVLLLILVIPLLAMGSLGGERHSGRIALWLSAPLNMSQLVGGKTLGLWFASLLILASSLSTLAALGLAVEVSWPRFVMASGVLLLLGLWVCSLSVCISGLFSHPAAGLATTYAILLFLWLLDSLGSADAAWQWLALLPHVKPALAGLLRSEDLIFFVATGATAFLLAVFNLARWRGEV